ncbi:MAG: hypothetical protein RMM53_03505 [Bacteroidia bacterium]|nr:hypothetical protein [Bacteroidia bacterium]MDW8333264.1 hypothetical protein [Bacteroidia bacterium]
MKSVFESAARDATSALAKFCIAAAFCAGTLFGTGCDRRPAEERLADRLCECARGQYSALEQVKKTLSASPFSEAAFIEKYEASVAIGDSCVKSVESDPEFVAVAKDPERLEAYRLRAGKLCVEKIRRQSEALFQKFKALRTRSSAS